MQLPRDFRELISELNAAGVEYVLVGAFAMGAYGMPRFTADIDFFYRPTAENAGRVIRALANFGFVSENLTVESLLEPNSVFMFGRQPMRVDFLNEISGVSFEEAWETRKDVEIDGIQVTVIGIRRLLDNKLASDRVKDRIDVEVLKKSIEVSEQHKSV